MRVETIVDLVLLEGVPDAEFDDSEPDGDPDFDEDFAPDFDFLMEPLRRHSMLHVLMPISRCSMA